MISGDSHKLYVSLLVGWFDNFLEHFMEIDGIHPKLIYPTYHALKFQVSSFGGFVSTAFSPPYFEGYQYFCKTQLYALQAKWFCLMKK